MSTAPPPALRSVAKWSTDENLIYFTFQIDSTPRRAHAALSPARVGPGISWQVCRYGLLETFQRLRTR